jgi:hypothetical protein
MRACTDQDQFDFWTLGNEIAGRSRRYRRVVIDEAAFAKNGDNKVDGSMMEIWEKAIKPTLFNYGGEVLICSNSAGKNPDNFFYNICTDPNYGFGEFHATTMDMPCLNGVVPSYRQILVKRVRLGRGRYGLTVKYLRIANRTTKSPAPYHRHPALRCASNRHFGCSNAD